MESYLEKTMWKPEISKLELYRQIEFYILAAFCLSAVIDMIVYFQSNSYVTIVTSAIVICLFYSLIGFRLYLYMIFMPNQFEVGDIAPSRLLSLETGNFIIDREYQVEMLNRIKNMLINECILTVVYSIFVLYYFGWIYLAKLSIVILAISPITIKILNHYKKN